jgi:hypothetical protein
LIDRQGLGKIHTVEVLTKHYDDPGAFYIGGLTYYHTGFVLAIHYGNTGEKVAETTVDISDGKLPEVVQLLGLNPVILSGMVVLGDAEGLTRQPAGEWMFEHDATTLDPFCVSYFARELPCCSDILRAGV